MSKLKKAMMRAKEARERQEGPSSAPPAAPAPEHRPAPPFPAPEPSHGVEAAPEGPRPEPPQTPPPTDRDDPAIPPRRADDPPPAGESPFTPTRTRVEKPDGRALRRNKVMVDCRKWGASDQIKILRTQVLNKLAEFQGNSLLITSANPREGKTFTAVNLAVSFSQELHRTALLIDADLRAPAVHRRFGLQVDGGLSDYLLGQRDLPDLLVNPGIPKLTVLPGGAGIPNSTELLGTPRMEGLVEEMKARYPDRFLIFDTSSVLTCADPLVFSRFVDGVLLVVAAEHTSRKDLQRALEMLENRPVIGIVYNMARDPAGGRAG
ncbi:MAG: hypothetical protein Kow0092_37330 [Deferrisomatales bacterium]